MAKLAKTLRENWKKSIFFSIAGAYGINFGYEKYEEQQLMKKFCKEALSYGEMTQHLTTKPYHVTVILNPAAQGGKARSKFENFCEPLLHLAGYKVSIIRTESNGQAKQILELMEEPNAVLVAGGDGTLMEAVTGMIRRKDSTSFCRNVVLGVLPVGYNNCMAKTLFPSADSDQSTKVTLMAEATMSVIRQLSRPIDVLEIENISEEDSEFHGKKLHGLRQVQFGAFRDSYERIDNYWFFPVIKKYLAHFFAYTTAAKHIMWNITGTLENQITEEITLTKDIEEKSSVSDQNTWMDYLFYFWPSVNASSSGGTSVDSNNPQSLTQKVNVWSEPIKCDSSELTIQSDNDVGLQKQKSDPRLQVTLGPQDIGIQQFLTEAWRRQWNKTMFFQPSSNKDSDNEGWHIFPELKSFKWTPERTNLDSSDSGDQKYFYLDGEKIELHGGMQVTMIPNQLTMFCTGSLHIPQVPINYDAPSDLSKKWWQRKSNIQSKTLK